MAQFYDLIVIICILIFWQVFSTVNGKEKNSPSPKVFLIGYKNFVNNSYTDEYEQNKTYDFLDTFSIQLSCVSDKPNLWRWKTDADYIYETVTKERRQPDKLSDKDYFVSNLTTEGLRLKERTFSCYYSDVDKRDEYQQNNSVACVQFYPKDNKIQVYDGISINDCLQTREHGFQNNNASANCSSGILIDLNKFVVSCDPSMGYLATKDIEDLDVANNYIYNYKRGQGSVCKIPTFGTVPQQYARQIPQTLAATPRIIYCRGGPIWQSFAVVYPDTKLDDIPQAKLIQFFAVKPEQNFADIILYYGRTTYEFVIGEVVTLQCVAVKYLFMDGFQWTINDKPFYDSNIDSSIQVTPNYLNMLSANVSMNATKFGNNFQIGCKAPVWNFLKFYSASINISLHPATIAVNNLTCIEDEKMINCSCQYSGRPQPTIKWFASSHLASNATLEENMEIALNNQISSGEGTWTSNKKFMKLVSAPGISSFVTCEAENLGGKRNAKYEMSKEDAQHGNLPMSLAITFSVLFGSVALIVSCIYVRISKKTRYLSKQEENMFYHGNATNVPTDEDNYQNLKFPPNYKIAKNTIELGSVIGSGQFGVVYQGVMSGHINVAVKVPSSGGDKEHFKSALTELKLLCYLENHANIVSLWGAYVGEIGRGKLYIVMELCENGSLQSYIRRMAKQENKEDESASVDLYELYKFCHEIALGMEYIAGKRVIHGDLATRNVLLTSELTCKIADFGLSRKLYTYNEYVKKSHEPLPWRWMAPESLRNMEFTSKSDVWSYAVTVWEIFSLGTIPYPGMTWTVNFLNHLDDGLRLGKAQHASNEIHENLLECFSSVPAERPEFSELVKYFADLRKGYSQYMDLDK